MRKSDFIILLFGDETDNIQINKKKVWGVQISYMCIFKYVYWEDLKDIRDIRYIGDIRKTKHGIG